MRAVRDLTLRGRCFLAAGAAAVVCGIQIGERDFVRIGLVALLVPTLCWLVVRRTERGVWIRRDVSALHVEAGETAQVEVQVGAAGRRTSTLLVEEEVSDGLGEPQRFTLDPIPAGGQTTLRYLLRTERRGRFPVGPLHVRVGDPLGMVSIDEVHPSTASVLVTPRTEPLPRLPLSGQWAGAGDRRTRDLLGGGSPDVTVREYRLGDDLRRIHWPTSARVDELMVRREEQQWQSRCTLLVDNRRIAHRGYGADSSMETAVRAAASIVRNLVALDFEVRLVTAAGQTSSAGWHQGSRGASLPEHLERLALMTTSRHEALATGWVDESQHGGMLLAVLGHLGETDQRLLSGFAAAGDSAYAVVLDVEGWERGRSSGVRPGEGTSATTAALQRGGWKATTLERDGSLATAWLGLSR